MVIKDTDKMKTISLDLLLDKIRSYEINILGFITTPWHLVGMRAFIEKMKAEGKYKKHIIIVGKHPQTGYVFNENTIPEDACVLECAEMPILHESFVKKLVYLRKLQSSSDDDSLYVVSAWNYRIESAMLIYKYTYRKCILCKVDEGVATYMFTSNSLYNSLMTLDLKLLFRYFGSIYAHRLLKRNLNCNLLVKKGSKLVPNEFIVPYYKKVLNVDNSNVEYIGKDVVIATMAFADDEVLNNELSIKIEKIINYLVEKGYNVIVKPHPRENNTKSKYSSMACRIADKTQSMEEFFMDYRPCALISFSSTCLITAELFYGIKSISMINLLEINNFSQKYKNELLSFKSTFANVVRFPKKLDEVILII